MKPLRREVVHELHGKLTSLVLFGLLLMLSAGMAGGPMTATLFAAAALVAVSTWLYVCDGWLQRRHTLSGAA